VRTLGEDEVDLISGDDETQDLLFDAAAGALRLVEIRDSHLGLVVIQALDGSIRTD
jgi:hypothetical protein